MSIKLGSLFDGSGGFPLAGALSGIEPVWASEVEPYPIAVTHSRFPQMMHLGSVTEVHGGGIEPVDVITFGSPCQDMSIAGMRAGMKHTDKGDAETTRSGLFYEAIRVIQEMREATNGEYPKYAVWENVPGAFSSNKGDDFRCVLEEFASVATGERTSIPLPEKSKWKSAGEIVGDGFSVAWRTLDAQYWGVPQRRKRIYLVADFTGECAGEILFECEGLPGHTPQGREAQQGVTDDAERSTDRSGQAVIVLNDQGGNQISVEKDAISPTLRAQSHQHEPVVCYDARGNGDGAHCPTLTGDHENRVTDYTAVCVMVHGQSNAEIAENISPTLNCNHEQPIITCGVDFRNVALGKERRKYIVRRLTPLECCRLQGFPDDWGVPDPKPELSADELAFWQGVRNAQAAISGKPPKAYSATSMTKWYNGLHTDSAEYKMWGNGIALPCAAFVLGNIANAIRKNA